MTAQDQETWSAIRYLDLDEQQKNGDSVATIGMSATGLV